MTTKDMIIEITKSIIAIIVVLGGGYAILTGNSQIAGVTGVMGVVIGYYFNRITEPVSPLKGK